MSILQNLIFNDKADIALPDWNMLVKFSIHYQTPYTAWRQCGTSLQVGAVKLETQSAIEFRYDCVAGRLAKVESLTEFPFRGRGLSKMLFIQPYNVMMSMASKRLQEK